jgi:sugar O-acyltransferase (sialic acid O-acetyltransferase NeuD family)
MENVVVVGASGQAKIAMDAIEKEEEYRIVGLIDSYKPVGSSCFGYQVIGSEEDLPRLVTERKIYGGLVAIGNYIAKRRLIERISELIPSFTFINAIHPSVQIACEVVLGKGILMMAGAIINSDSRVGDHCTLCTGASLDHDSTMHDYSFLSAGVTVGGRCTIGAFSFISLGAKVISGVSVGEHAVVGAGATVVKDVPGYVVAYGTPARVIRTTSPEDKIL